MVEQARLRLGWLGAGRLVEARRTWVVRVFPPGHLVCFSMGSRALVAEFIGTFALCFIGIGSIAAAAATGGGLIIPALAHGLAIACLASAVGHISGGHFNPAVSLGLLLTNRMKAADAGAYIVAQVLGAIAGSFAVAYAFGSTAMADIKHGIPAFSDPIMIGQAIVVEIILTFFLVFVIFGTAVDSKAPKMGALFIGLTVTLDILMGGPITGACMNPARYLGPAVASGNFGQILTYMIGPIVGGALAALVYDKVLMDKTTAS